MKKVICLNTDNEMKLIILLTCIKVKGINSCTLEEGMNTVLKVNGLLKDKNGRLIGSFNCNNNKYKKLLPNTKTGLALNNIWDFLNNLSFGTKEQMSLLKDYNFNMLEDIIGKHFEDVLSLLEKNNLMKDREFLFGSKLLINPLPKDVLDKVDFIFNS
ncbi:hypothetical protein [Clostridioides difficile]|uniref:hypothetical protein n=1 Tax=Clostridioides difficile TaxID=1496 RepID=UPI000BB1E451|nr:hypothetical protein [Clostridioides difficile]PBG00042.1 hypothetical protein BGV00_05920 [Clostridioides difficile]